MADEKLIAAIKRAHRERCFLMETRKMVDLRLGAHIRTSLGWRKDLPEAERKAIADQAAQIIEEEAEPFARMIVASNEARKIFAVEEKDRLKELEQLAEQLPVWSSFGESIRGFGLGSLAVIVAEAGDLDAYASEAKLWKRMGLAVMGGVRQGGLGKSASKEDWIEHGYSPNRRSRIWNIGDALIKGNRDGVYRAVYLARKEYELARDPEMPKIKAHRRAQRYMEKRLLRNLWRAWRHADAIESLAA